MEGLPPGHDQSSLAVTVDREGSLYIADAENHRIRKVDKEGTITTIAGTGEEGYSGDGEPHLRPTHLSSRSSLRRSREPPLWLTPLACE